MKRTLAGVMAALAWTGAPVPSAAVPAGLVAERVAALAFPTGMAFTASGDRLFVNERGGRVRVIQRGRLLPQPVAEIATTTQAESGLLGLALHPRFESGEPWLYVFHTLPGGGRDRVLRLRIQDNRSTERQIVMDDLPAGGYHHGGILAFAPDGTLFVSHGEEHDANKAQQPRVLGGKIYRLNADGSIPGDNPFGTSPTFAYGIRNPFGL
ncbi:MAG: PQQ-dependent sugar dehydrogenase, partial [Actinomycetota bacterium]